MVSRHRGIDPNGEGRVGILGNKKNEHGSKGAEDINNSQLGERELDFDIGRSEISEKTKNDVRAVVEEGGLIGKILGIFNIGKNKKEEKVEKTTPQIGTNNAGVKNQAKKTIPKNQTKEEETILARDQLDLSIKENRDILINKIKSILKINNKNIFDLKINENGDIEGFGIYYKKIDLSIEENKIEFGKKLIECIKQLSSYGYYINTKVKEGEKIFNENTNLGEILNGNLEGLNSITDKDVIVLKVEKRKNIDKKDSYSSNVYVQIPGDDSLEIDNLICYTISNGCSNMKSLNIEMIKLVISFIKKEVTGNELYIKVWSFILNRERDFIDEINIEEFEEFEELKKIIERKGKLNKDLEKKDIDDIKKYLSKNKILEINPGVKGSIHGVITSIARDIKPVNGEDAKINFIHSVVKNHGTVEGEVFMHINAYGAIKKGDKILTLIPEGEGRNGSDIEGKPLKARDGKKGYNAEEIAGKGIKIIKNINGTYTLEAEEDGFIIFNNKNNKSIQKIIINDVPYIEEISNSTGILQCKENELTIGEGGINMCVDIEVNNFINKGNTEGSVILIKEKDDVEGTIAEFKGDINNCIIIIEGTKVVNMNKVMNNSLIYAPNSTINIQTLESSSVIGKKIDITNAKIPGKIIGTEECNIGEITLKGNIPLIGGNIININGLNSDSTGEEIYIYSEKINKLEENKEMKEMKLTSLQSEKEQEELRKVKNEIEEAKKLISLCAGIKEEYKKINILSIIGYINIILNKNRKIKKKVHKTLRELGEDLKSKIKNIQIG